MKSSSGMFVIAAIVCGTRDPDCPKPHNDTRTADAMAAPHRVPAARPRRLAFAARHEHRPRFKKSAQR
jgi:hypothetical protein